MQDGGWIAQMEFKSLAFVSNAGSKFRLWISKENTSTEVAKAKELLESGYFPTLRHQIFHRRSGTRGVMVALAKLFIT
jgi:hypothetical protein